MNLDNLKNSNKVDISRPSNETYNFKNFGVAYISSISILGGDTIQFTGNRSDNTTFILRFGRSGISYLINDVVIWTR